MFYCGTMHKEWEYFVYRDGHPHLVLYTQYVDTFLYTLVYVAIMYHGLCVCVCVCVCCRYFRTEESKESVLAIPVGSVTAKTELTYEYGVRRKPTTEKKTDKKSIYMHSLYTETLHLAHGYVLYAC